MSTRKCFRCKVVRHLSRFPKQDGSNRAALCNNCRMDHRLDTKNRDYYHTTDEATDDFTTVVDNELERLWRSE